MNINLPDPELAALADFAQLAAQAAAKIILPYFQNSPDIQTKADGSPVTIADKNAEQCILDLIRKHRPNDGWLGEEFGEQEGTSGYRWIIDPIDGTVPFIHGVPLFGTLLAVQKNDQTLLGLINMPALNEMVIGIKGAGTFHNGQPCRVSATANIADATILTSNYSDLPRHDRQPAFNKLTSQAKESRTWGDCYGYLLVATGRAEIMIDSVLAPWDIAPMLPIITEAGGRITDLDGGEDLPAPHALASNGFLQEQALAAFAS